MKMRKLLIVAMSSMIMTVASSFSQPSNLSVVKDGIPDRSGQYITPDRAHVIPLSDPEPTPSPNPGGTLEIQCNHYVSGTCGVQCRKCYRCYYSSLDSRGKCTAARGCCRNCGGIQFVAL